MCVCAALAPLPRVNTYSHRPWAHPRPVAILTMAALAVATLTMAVLTMAILTTACGRVSRRSSAILTMAVLTMAVLTMAVLAMVILTYLVHGHGHDCCTMAEVRRGNNAHHGHARHIYGHAQYMAMPTPCDMCMLCMRMWPCSLWPCPLWLYSLWPCALYGYTYYDCILTIWQGCVEATREIIDRLSKTDS